MFSFMFKLFFIFIVSIIHVPKLDMNVFSCISFQRYSFPRLITTLLNLKYELGSHINELWNFMAIITFLYTRSCVLSFVYHCNKLYNSNIRNKRIDEQRQNASTWRSLLLFTLYAQQLVACGWCLITYIQHRRDGS